MGKQQREITNHQWEITNHQWKISKQQEIQNNAVNNVKQISMSHVIMLSPELNTIFGLWFLSNQLFCMLFLFLSLHAFSWMFSFVWNESQLTKKSFYSDRFYLI